jgi:predicted pyridoxine 5'-phosphate oxidase superfamily flavin-nucleotide-binding protein
MSSHYLDIATTPSVAAAQVRYNGRARPTAEGTASDRLGPNETAFIQSLDGFYLGTVSESGWPYIQYRGGAPGFLRVLAPDRIGFADFAGNRQYLTTGNLNANQKVALFLMDYAERRRLKVLGHATIVDPNDDDILARVLTIPDYRAKVERLIEIRIEAFDWNCSRHIMPRFSATDVAATLAVRDQRIAELTAEIERLRATHAP